MPLASHRPVSAPPPKVAAPAVIEVIGLRKSYGALEAVRGIDLQVEAGEIFGIIGPDGAGKTSAFNVLGGVTPQTAGRALMNGLPPRETRRNVGYLTQTFSLYQDLTVEENLQYVGKLRLVPGDEIRQRGQHYLEMFGMARFTQRLAGRLSGGMKQKLALACALIGQPRILLLDEPTTGVDPVSRREFWDTLAHLSSQGMTILIATPYLDEAERCHRVALMFEGQIIESGTPRELRQALGLRRLEVRGVDLQKAEPVLAALPSIHDVQRFGDRLGAIVANEEVAASAIEAALQSALLGTPELHADLPTLENVFVSKISSIGHAAVNKPFPRKSARLAADTSVAIGCDGLSKEFGEFTAVRDLHLEVHYGEIYGLLGANGAGKTTAIKMLCGLLPQTRGSITLAGEHGALRSEQVRRKLGYMSQKFSLYDDLTIAQNLDFFGAVYGVPPTERIEKREWVLDFSGLAGRGNVLTGSLPGGWKQRVAFGAAIQHEPRVVFLDEPTSGVDPLARRDFWRMINELADNGAAILITTHYLEEAEQCNRLGFMVDGQLVAEGTPTGVKAQQEGFVLEISTDAPQRALEVLQSHREHWRVSLFGDRIHFVTYNRPEREIEQLRMELYRAGIKVERARQSGYSLEDVFLAVIAKAQQTAVAGAA
jgi:ABC-2 type transport system ATP-binding protein